jgi:hypothetical protein
MEFIFAGIVTLGVIGAFGFIIVTFYKMIQQSRAEARANRASPIETVSVEVVAKRPLVSGGGNDSSASTTYFATFEFTDGSREEFRVPGKDYGMMAEGDHGLLTRQGTWFTRFERLVRQSAVSEPATY